MADVGHAGEVVVTDVGVKGAGVANSATSLHLVGEKEKRHMYLIMAAVHGIL